MLNSTFSEVVLLFQSCHLDRKSTDSFERTHDIKTRLYVQNVQFEAECSVHIFVCKDEMNK